MLTIVTARSALSRHNSHGMAIIRQTSRFLSVSRNNDGRTRRLSSPALTAEERLQRVAKVLPAALEHHDGSSSSSNSSSNSSPSASSLPAWTRECRRTGALAFKLGMMSHWDSWGVRHPVTVLHLDGCQALGNFPLGNAHIMNVGVGSKSLRQTQRTELSYFLACKVNPKLHVKGFSVTKDAILRPGTKINAAHFVAGQYIDVQARSIGKGFQGAMKRWGFKGMPASHGVSLSHRSIGSTGSRSTPGRVMKGKKMAGQMGASLVTVKKLKVLKVDHRVNCIFVRGAVPGHDNALIRITDTHCHENNALFSKTPPPYPTAPASHLLPLAQPGGNDAAAVLPRCVVAPANAKDPLFRDSSASS